MRGKRTGIALPWAIANLAEPAIGCVHGRGRYAGPPSWRRTTPWAAAERKQNGLESALVLSLGAASNFDVDDKNEISTVEWMSVAFQTR